MYIRTLMGKRLYLSPANPEDFEKCTHWINDNEAGLYIGQVCKSYSYTAEREAREKFAKGYGSEAITLLLDYAFNALNLNNIMLTVKALNERAIACYRKCGFREFGGRREDNFIAGRRYDTVYMDILSKDFAQPSFIEGLIK